MRLLPVWALPVSAVLLKVFRGAWTHWLCFRVKVTGPRISQGRPTSSLLGLRTPKSAAPGIRGPRGFLGGERPPGASVSAPFPFLLPESFSHPRPRSIDLGSPPSPPGRPPPSPRCAEPVRPGPRARSDPWPSRFRGFSVGRISVSVSSSPFLHFLGFWFYSFHNLFWRWPWSL